MLTLALCLNLLGCNLVHFPAIIRKMQAKMPAAPASEPLPLLTGDPNRLLQEMGFRSHQEQNGCRYAVRNRIGHWGAWLTHLGILIIIAGFALGQMYTVKYTVYGVPGQEKPVGDTGYTLKIDDFDILLREDNTVDQYLAQLTLTDSRTGVSHSGPASVNHPFDAAGYRLYQNSMGWAADIAVFHGDELQQAEIICVGESLTVKGQEDLVLLFRAFYPDYVQRPDGMPATASDSLENPGYLYALYYRGELLGMNVLMSGEKITVSGYTILLTNPRPYTLIQVKQDPFTWLAGIGGGVLLAALFIAFYLRTEELWLTPAVSGWLVVGRSRKGSLLYREKLIEKINLCNEVTK